MKKTIIIILLPIFLLTFFCTQAQNPDEGKLVFASEPFADGTSPQQKTSFRSDEFIYMKMSGNNNEPLHTFFLKEKPTKNVEGKMFYYNLEVYKDGTRKGRKENGEIYFNEIDLLKTAQGFDLLPQPEKASTVFLGYAQSSTCEGLYEQLTNKYIFDETGDYTIKVLVFGITVDDWGARAPVDKWPTFRGEFNLHFDTKDVLAIMNNHGKSRKVIEDYARNYAGNKARKQHAENVEKETSERPVTAGWTAKSSPLSKSLNMNEIKKYAVDGTAYKILKVYTGTDYGWKVAKNSLDIPTAQYLDQTIEIYVKKEDNTCAYISILANKPYLGGGRYGPVKLFKSVNKLLCEKLKE